MRKFIEHMRNQPEDHKHSVAMGIAFVVSVFIFLAWLTGFFGGEDKEQLAGSSDVINPSNPIESIKNDFKSLLTDTSAQ